MSYNFLTTTLYMHMYVIIILSLFLIELLRKPIERLQSYSLVLTVSCVNIVIIFIIIVILLGSLSAHTRGSQ